MVAKDTAAEKPGLVAGIAAALVVLLVVVLRRRRQAVIPDATSGAPPSPGNPGRPERIGRSQ